MFNVTEWESPVNLHVKAVGDDVSWPNTSLSLRCLFLILLFYGLVIFDALGLFLLICLLIEKVTIVIFSCHPTSAPHMISFGRINKYKG